MRQLIPAVMVLACLCATASAQVKYEYARFYMDTRIDVEAGTYGVFVAFHSADKRYTSRVDEEKRMESFAEAYEGIAGKPWTDAIPETSTPQEVAMLNALGEAGWQIIHVSGSAENPRASWYLLQRVRP